MTNNARLEIRLPDAEKAALIAKAKKKKIKLSKLVRLGIMEAIASDAT